MKEGSAKEEADKSKSLILKRRTRDLRVVIDSSSPIALVSGDAKVTARHTSDKSGGEQQPGGQPAPTPSAEGFVSTTKGDRLGANRSLAVLKGMLYVGEEYTIRAYHPTDQSLVHTETVKLVAMPKSGGPQVVTLRSTQLGSGWYDQRAGKASTTDIDATIQKLHDGLTVKMGVRSTSALIDFIERANPSDKDLQSSVLDG